jgi:hypothetical protein
MSENPIPTEAGNPPASFIAALRRVLLALVRLLMHFRVVYPQLAELLKSVYVEVAEREYQLDGKPQTITRLSMLTGIHRKDVKRLQNQMSAGVEEPLGVSQPVRIIARWIGDSEYLDAQGKPLPLPYKSADGPDFEALVQSVVRQDLRPRVILDEWLSVGTVRFDEQERLVLNVDSFIPSQGIEEKAFFLGMNVGDHLDAATHNLQGKKPPFFERCVYYDELSAASVAELRALAEARGMEILKEINEKAMTLKARDKQQGGGTQRFNVGVYVYHEDSADQEAGRT